MTLTILTTWIGLGSAVILRQQRELSGPGRAIAVGGDPAAEEGVGIELILAPDTGLPPAVVHYRDGDVNDPWLYTTRQEGAETLPG